MSTDSTAHPDRPRRGRRPGPNETRQAILAAARACFARDGYAGTTIRKIAVAADVDASLVIQLYGTKEELFAAVMSITSTALTHFARAFGGPEHQLGERVTRAFLDVWEGDPSDAEPLLAMLRGAITNEQATTQLREFIEARLLLGLRPELRHDPTARTRAGLAASMLVGLIVGRQLVRVPTVRDVDTETLVALVAPAMQAILTGSTTST